MAEHGVAGISGIDTRAVTRRIRIGGRPARASSPARSTTPAAAVAQGPRHPSLEGRDLVRRGDLARALRVDRAGLLAGAPGAPSTRRRRPPVHVVAYDFGIKRGILRHLRAAAAG